MELLVIGGGPGGYVAAIRAAQLGAQVTLIERQWIGGTCLNVGCIPTKALLHTAELFEQTKEGKSFGLCISDAQIDFTQAQKNKEQIVERLTTGVSGLLAANRVKVILGSASFLDAHTVKVQAADNEHILTPDRIIVATGSIPANPPIPGIDGPACMDSTAALALHEVPKSMVVIGGGVIGVEMGYLYSVLGCQVTIVEMMQEILPMMDSELIKMLHSQLEKKGVNILTSASVSMIESQGETVVVRVKTKDGEMNIKSEKVLVSIGRKSDTGALDLEKANVYAPHGAITVNERMETNVPGIYAIGDCTGGTMLAHVASTQGEVAAENAAGHQAIYQPPVVPVCVYTSPEFASVGLTEQKAAERGIDYIVGKFPTMANGKCLVMGSPDGMVKMIAERTSRELIGVHILGPRATDLIAECTLAIKEKKTIDSLADCIHPHPTVSEMIREAALSADYRAIHIPNL